MDEGLALPSPPADWSREDAEDTTPELKMVWLDGCKALHAPQQQRMSHDKRIALRRGLAEGSTLLTAPLQLDALAMSLGISWPTDMGSVSRTRCVAPVGADAEKALPCSGGEERQHGGVDHAFAHVGT